MSRHSLVLRSEHCLVERHLLDHDLPPRLPQRHGCELLGQDEGLVFLVAVADQLARLRVDLQSPHVDLLQHDDELLDHLVLDQARDVQPRIRVQQLPQPHIVLECELGAARLALAESGGFVAQVVEEEAEFEVRVLGGLVVHDALLLLEVLEVVALGRLGLLEEVVLLAAAGEALLALLVALVGDVHGVLEVLVAAVGALAGQLLEHVLVEGQHARFVDGGLALLAVEEDLVGVGDREDGDDLARPEGVVLALREHHLAYLELHRVFILYQPILQADSSI